MKFLFVFEQNFCRVVNEKRLKVRTIPYAYIRQINFNLSKGF